MGLVMRQLELEALSGKAIYDIDNMFEVLVAQEDLTQEGAIEYLDYNVRWWITPIYIQALKLWTYQAYIT